MLIQSLGIGVAIGLAAAAGGCGTPSSNVVNGGTSSQGVVMNTSNGTSAASQDRSVSQRFATLDDYLAWLRKTQAPVDGSWYEEIRPGVYKLHTGNLRILGPGGDETPRNQTFSRAQLEKQFGFSR